jgi:acyl carrier protein
MSEKERIYTEVRNVMVELFELDPDSITPEARLAEDLDLDSIDAVDLVVRLQHLTGRKLRPEEFKAVRTVGDVVDAAVKLLD